MIELITHIINFKIKKNLARTFNYNFWMQILYLIDNENTLISTPSQQKHKLDK